MATRQNTDFLTFNAYSIKDLITRKLSEDKNVTDQIYEGSNLATLIDIFSYMAQTMLYNLNNAASESMFSDTQFYENINRLVQFLGYTPHGMQPASVLMELTKSHSVSVIDDDTSLSRVIPAYCYIDTGKVDKNGKKVYYSIDKCSFLKNDEDLVEKFLKGKDNPNIYFTQLKNKNAKKISLHFYNGLWKSYPTIFTAGGTPFESFVLNGLKSDSNTNDYVGHGFIDVFVEKANGDIEQYIANDGQIFKAQKFTDHIFGTNDRIYSLRLNENKTYVLTFGDGLNGKKLDEGDKIHVLYLDSNGSDTELEIGEVTKAKLVFPSEIFRDFPMTDESNFVKKMFGMEPEEFTAFVSNLNYEAKNISTSTEPMEEETVEEIRQNAPAWFRMANRLVTKNDYEYYLKSRSFTKSKLIDVKVMNNWEYISTFYKWLYELGSKITKYDGKPDSRYFLKPEKLVRYYKYADPADSNNIYIWTAIYTDTTGSSSSIVTDFSDGQEASMVEAYKHSLILVKDLTHEPTFIPPIRMQYAICAQDDYNKVIDKLRNRGGLVYEEDDTDENYVEITLNDNVVYSNNAMIRKVASTINSAFDPKSNLLGQGVNLENVLNELYKIEGINRVRTVYHNKITDQHIIRNGLSFATWSDLTTVNGSDFIGLDLEVGNTTRSLLPFQFPVLPEQNKTNWNIKIIKHSVSYLNEVIY